MSIEFLTATVMIFGTTDNRLSHRSPHPDKMPDSPENMHGVQPGRSFTSVLKGHKHCTP
jgi:hypothetical protein